MAKRKILIWSDYVEQVIGLRDELRAKGDTVSIRDAKFLYGSFVEKADVLMFSNAANKDVIVAAYRSPGYRDRYGKVEFIDVSAGSFGEPIEVPALPPVPTETPEPDALDAQIAAMGDEELRETYQSLMGNKPHHKKSPDSLKAEILAELRKTGE